VQQPVRVIQAETAITMRQLMEGVVLHGTGTAARLAGYTVGGKTGSAQIFDVAAKHYTHTYNGSFVGFAPVTNPSLVVVVTLNGTHGTAGFGGAAAAPVFRTVATEALRVMDVPKDLPDEPSALTLVARIEDLAAPDDRPGQPNILEDGEEEAAAQPAGGPGAGGQGPGAVGQGSGAVGQRPRAVGQGPGGGSQGPEGGGQKTVPNFKGKTMRAVLAEAAAKGLTVLPAGSGVARVQHPPAGATLQQGERIRVQFVR
jgi:membrane peptidoglycan carboxypeptidase